MSKRSSTSGRARAFQQGDDAGLADAGLHFQPQSGQRLGHDAGRARLLEI